MNTLGERLRSVRKELGFKTQGELAKKIGGKTTHVSVSEWERDKYKPDGENLIRLLEVTGLSKKWLYSGKGEKFASALGKNNTSGHASYSYPKLEWHQVVAWKENMEISDSAQTYSIAPYNGSDSSYILEVKGQSMTPEFSDGDLILVDPEIKEKNNSFIVVIIENQREAMLRQLVLDGNKKYLKALNPDWPAKIIEFNDSISVSGVVIGKWKQYT